MLFARSRVEQITEKLGDESFREPQYRAIYQALIAAGPESPIDEVTEHLDDDAVGTVEDLLAEGSYQMDPERTISDSLATPASTGSRSTRCRARPHNSAR